MADDKKNGLVDREFKEQFGDVEQVVEGGVYKLRAPNGSVETVQASEVGAKFRQGYTGSVFVNAPTHDGRQQLQQWTEENFRVAGEDADGLVIGPEGKQFVRQQFEERVRNVVDDEYTAEAFGDAVVDTVSFGGSRLLRSEGEQERRRLIAEENPMATVSGEVAGALSTVFLGTGVGSALMRGSMNTASKALGQRGAVLVGELGLEAATSLQLQAADAAIFDKRLTAQGVAANLGIDMLIGGGILAGAKGLSRLRSGAASRLGKTEIGQQLRSKLSGKIDDVNTATRLQDITELQNLSPEDLRSVYEEASITNRAFGKFGQVTGIPDEYGTYLARHADDVVRIDRNIAAAAEDVTKSFNDIRSGQAGLTKAWENTKKSFDFSDVAEDAAKRTDDFLSTLENSLKNRLLDAEGPARTTSREALQSLKRKRQRLASLSVEEIPENLNRLAQTWFRDFGKNDAFFKNEGYHSIKSFIRDESIWGSAGMQRQLGDKAIKTLTDFHKSFANRVLESTDNLTDAGKVVTSKKVLNRLKKDDVNNFVINQLENADRVLADLDALKKVGDADMLKRIEAFENSVGRARSSLDGLYGTVEKPGALLLRSIHKQATEAFKSGGSSISRRVMGAVLGGAIGGPGGAIAGAVFKSTVNPLELLDVVGKVRAIRSSNETLFKTIGTKSNVINKAFKSGSTVARPASASALMALRYGNLSAEDKRKQFEEIHADMRVLFENPDIALDRMQQATEVVQDYDPGTSAELANTAGMGLSYLFGSLPRGTTRFGVEDLSTVSDTEIDMFLERYAALQDPTGLLDSVADGTITPDAVEAVVQVMPAVYAEMMMPVIDAMVDNQSTLSYEQSLALSTFLMQPIDESVKFTSVLSLQSPVAQTQQQDIAQRSPQGLNQQRAKQFSDNHLTDTVRLTNKV